RNSLRSRRMRDPDDFDNELRATAFAYIQQLQAAHGGLVEYADLAEFQFRGERIALMDRQRGIRKPAVLEAALSFRTVHAKTPDMRPYDDAPGPDGFLRYKWRGVDPDHAENRALRTAAVRQLPLVWFQGVAPGVYFPI